MNILDQSFFSGLLVCLVVLSSTSRSTSAQLLLSNYEVNPGFELIYKALEETRHPENFQSGQDSNPHSLVKAANFLTQVNSRLKILKHALAEATWNFQVNASVENTNKLAEVTEHYNAWYVYEQDEAKRYKNNTNLTEDMTRQLKIFTLTAIARDRLVRRRQAELENAMVTQYNTGVVQLSYKASPEHHTLTVMSTSRDPQLLQRAWLNWRDAIGPPIRPLYREYVDVLNLAANENGFPDYSAYWKQSLVPDSPDLEEMLERLWLKLRPLYTQLHAYVRHRLTLKYGVTVVGTDGTIPTHLLGDMWAQHWTNINDILSPYPDLDDTLVVEAELRKRYTALDMFRLAESLYTSLGFPEMTRHFWRESHLVKRSGESDGSEVCQASAFDLYFRGDYRIKMCAKVNLSDLKTILHEMGHIEYFMAYSDQPTLYRAPPTAAFHESVGDLAQLSVLSDRSLRALGILPDLPLTNGRSFEERIRKRKSSLNRLMQVALDKLAFLPFGLLVDRWRWQVFQGNITPDDYNRKWWKLRLQCQGMMSPVPRSERDFDPGAKFHIPAHMPFASYFVAYIQEFQMYKALCDVSGHKGLLHECDLHRSREAGRKLRDILKAGASKPWQELLHTLTGSDVITADAILEYFRPLETWLKRYNKRHRQTIGWEGAKINWEHE